MPIQLKRISAAVGRSGSNLPADVRVIKYLLNTVPAEDGGPPGVIVESTTIPVLVSLIERFQLQAVGRADGRVDVEGRTLRMLREFDPTPNDPPFVPNFASGKKRSQRKKGDRS